MNDVNILIAGLTAEELVQKAKQIAQSNHKMREILERNQISFICYFFSDFLMKDGKYIQGARFKDLIIIYYVDYRIKMRLSDHALKIERYLNNVILNMHEKGKISKRTSDKQNTFGRIRDFFSNELNEVEQNVVIDEFNRIYQTDFSIKNFEEAISEIVRLRNFTLHHYPVVSYNYAGVIGNGNRHTEKDGKSITLNKTMVTLCKFIDDHSARRLREIIEKILNKYNFSSDEIFEHVFKGYREVLNFEALKNVSKANPHFSIINLIQGKKKKI